MKGIFFYSFLFFFVVACGSVNAQNSSLVYPDAAGKLIYKPFANFGETNAVNIIPDFSYSGYKGGGVPIPVIPVVETISPISGDAKTLIQSAIDRVSARPLNANGYRGAILLKSGKYEVNGSLYIKASGVVLRGEGQNTPVNGGTEIIAAATVQHDFIQLKGNETISEVSVESVLDTKLYPAVRTWQVFNVTKGVAEELESNRIISFHVTSDVNQFVSYSSREDSVKNRPVLEITVKNISTGKESIISLQPAADTYVQGGTNAKTNYGNDLSLAVKNSGVNNDVTREAYLKFNLPEISDSIIGAVLKLYTKKDLAGDPAAIKTVNITVSSLIYDEWDEMILTYETRPKSSSTGNSKKITTAYVPSGTRSFDVDDVSGLAVADTIKVTRTPNDAWINALDMAQYGWIASDYEVSYERIITGINGKTITVNIPLVQAITTSYGGGVISKSSVSGRISNCGVENMLLTSVYSGDEDESHGWSAVTLSETSDCWVQKVTARYFGYSCVGLYWAYNTTVEECAMLDPKSITTGSRKYSFYIDKGSFNLFQRCFTRGGRHDYVTGSRVAGPNAFVDCYSTATYADIGPHHRYATGLLFDNIEGGETRVQNRKDMGSGHGWAGAQTMFWNCKSDASEFKVESPLGALNWGIGCTGLVQNGAGFWESWKTQVLPRSLYFQQLKDRLGNSAVEKVTITEQRLGNIWGLLSKWGGVGNLTSATNINSKDIVNPAKLAIEQNYPNPFNPVTNIRFSVSVKGRTIVKIFDLLGREMAKIFDAVAEPGKSYTAQYNAIKAASGVYLAQLEFDGNRLSKKMVLIK